MLLLHTVHVSICATAVLLACCLTQRRRYPSITPPSQPTTNDGTIVPGCILICFLTAATLVAVAGLWIVVVAMCHLHSVLSPVSIAVTLRSLSQLFMRLRSALHALCSLFIENTYTVFTKQWHAVIVFEYVDQWLVLFSDVRIFEIFEYLPSPISYLFKQNDADFSP